MNDFEESFAEGEHSFEVELKKHDHDRKIYNEIDSFSNCLTPLNLQKAMMEEIEKVQEIASFVSKLFFTNHKD
jgi:hypothetical protein